MEDFEKFDLNKKTETVATDNTLPAEPEPDFANMKSPEHYNIAQWAINNRYPRSEDEKIGDFEYYTELCEMIEKLLDTQREQERQKYEARIKELQQMLKNGLLTGIKETKNEAIQECIDTVFSMVGNTDFYPSQVARELSKLKG